MWPFTHRHVPRPGELLSDHTDWHCHLLPGVDDGISRMEDTLTVLTRYQEFGITHVWLTPHIMEDIPNTTQQLRARYQELQQAYTGPVQLHLAAEYMLDNLFQERLTQGDLLPIGQDGTTLLVETSYFNPPMDLEGIMQQIRDHGYQPLLAHPERYVYMDKTDYAHLHQIGIQFQGNLPSLTGAYGREAQKKIRHLHQNGLIAHWGTDMHRTKMVDDLMINDK